MDALVTLSYALGTRTKSWLGHGCSNNRMLLEHEPNLAWHGCSGNRMHWNTNDFWFRHACFANRVLLKHVLLEQEEVWFRHGCSVNECSWNTTELWSLGMDALATVCSLKHERNGN